MYYIWVNGEKREVVDTSAIPPKVEEGYVIGPFLTKAAAERDRKIRFQQTMKGANGRVMIKSSVLERLVKTAMRDALQDLAVPTITGLVEAMGFYFDELDDDDLMMWAADVIEGAK